MLITSSDNKTIKLIKKLIDDKKKRDETNMIVIEGERSVSQMIENSHPYKFILVSHDSKYVKKYSKFNNVYTIKNSIYSSISTSANSDGVIAVFDKQYKKLELTPSKKYIILDTVQNPNNLGSIFRSCLAFGIDGIIMYNSTDPFNINSLRSSMGSVFELPFMITTNLKTTIEKLKSIGYDVYATILDEKAQDISKIKKTNGIAIVFGNEGNGIKKDIIDVCNSSVYIKISNKIDSLNVAITVAIVSYELSK